MHYLTDRVDVIENRLKPRKMTPATLGSDKLEELTARVRRSEKQREKNDDLGMGEWAKAQMPFDMTDRLEACGRDAYTMKFRCGAFLGIIFAALLLCMYGTTATLQDEGAQYNDNEGLSGAQGASPVQAEAVMDQAGSAMIPISAEAGSGTIPVSVEMGSVVDLPMPIPSLDPPLSPLSEVSKDELMSAVAASAIKSLMPSGSVEMGSMDDLLMPIPVYEPPPSPPPPARPAMKAVKIGSVVDEVASVIAGIKRKEVHIPVLEQYIPTT